MESKNWKRQLNRWNFVFTKANFWWTRIAVQPRNAICTCTLWKEKIQNENLKCFKAMISVIFQGQSNSVIEISPSNDSSVRELNLVHHRYGLMNQFFPSTVLTPQFQGSYHNRNFAPFLYTYIGSWKWQVYISYISLQLHICIYILSRSPQV